MCVCVFKSHLGSVFLHMFLNLTLHPLCSYVGVNKSIFQKILSWNIEDR